MRRRLRPRLEFGVEPVDAGAKVRIRLLRRRRPHCLHLERTQRRVRRVGLQLLLWAREATTHDVNTSKVLARMLLSCGLIECEVLRARVECRV